MLGNAVPSLLAEVLARGIRAQLLDVPPRQNRLKLLPPKRSDTPPMERTRPVPKNTSHSSAIIQSIPVKEEALVLNVGASIPLKRKRCSSLKHSRA